LDQSLRTLGVDDGYFPTSYKKSNKKTLLALVECRDLTITKVKLSLITIDGLDGTEVLLKNIESLKNKYRVIFLDGVTYAGFNIIDPEEIYNKTLIPVITVFKHRLNLNLVKEALMKNFNDWLVRYSVIERTYNKSYEITTPKGNLIISLTGIDIHEAYNIIVRLQNISQYPEPLRLADIVASGLTKNTSLLEIINKN
jgi:endonuclease V-like protein UPF0215 family